MKKGQKYKLISFNGTTESSEACTDNENCWILIGQQGTVVNFPQDLNFCDENRILMQFDQDVKKQGLECHNSVENALWILKSDLEQIK